MSPAPKISAWMAGTERGIPSRRVTVNSTVAVISSLPKTTLVDIQKIGYRHEARYDSTYANYLERNKRERQRNQSITSGPDPIAIRSYVRVPEI